MPIHCIEFADMQSAVMAWNLSRDLDKPTTPREVAQVDASINEMPSALFHFQDMMILERELAATFRNHVIWARTSRVDDPRKFTVPEQFVSTIHSEIRAAMEGLDAEGVPQDRWRVLLPICAQTSWVVRLSLRDLYRLANYFADVADRIGMRNPKLCNRLIATASDILEAGEEAFGLSRDTMLGLMSAYKRVTLPPAVQDFGVGIVRREFGEIVAMQMKMPLALRAQLVRHREVIIADEFVALLCAPGSEQYSIDTGLVVQMSATKAVWNTILGKRACWMAQADLWTQIASLYGNSIHTLPCASGACPYGQDALLRVEGKDPGSPCPRHGNISGIKLNGDQLRLATEQVNRLPAETRAMWSYEIVSNHRRRS